MGTLTHKQKSSRIDSWLWKIALCLAVVIAFSSSTAMAQAEQAFSLSTDDLEAAQLRFNLGVQHVEREQWREALAEFEASIAAAPNRSALFNRALCLKYLERYNESLRAFEDYLETLDNETDDARRIEAHDHMVAISLQPDRGSLRLVSNIPDAEVWIDGALAGTAREQFLLEPGPHDIAVGADRYRTHEQRVDIHLGRQQIEVSLSRRRAQVVPRSVVWLMGGCSAASFATSLFLLGGSASQGFHDYVFGSLAAGLSSAFFGATALILSFFTDWSRQERQTMHHGDTPRVPFLAHWEADLADAQIRSTQIGAVQAMRLGSGSRISR